MQTQYTYEPFGKTTLAGATTNNSFAYTGREFDEGTGLYSYRSRYYDPGTGRFISEDPVEFEGGIHLYAYVANNPLSFADPLGTQPCDRARLIAAQDYARNNPAWQQIRDNGPTYCNFATQSIIAAMNAPSLPGMANDMAQNLATSSNYQPVLPDQAHAIANAGGLVIVAWSRTWARCHSSASRRSRR